MEELVYKVIFKGEIAPGNDRELVKKNLASFYNVDLHKADVLLSGKAFIIKEGLTLDSARKYMLHFLKMGAQCQMIKMEEPTLPFPESSTDEPSLSPIQKQTQESQISGIPETKQPASIQIESTKQQNDGVNDSEVRFRTVFRGGMIKDKNREEIKTNLSLFLKRSEAEIERYFSGVSLIIEDKTDFVSAVESYKQFLDYGAICRIEPVIPYTLENWSITNFIKKTDTPLNTEIESTPENVEQTDESFYWELRHDLSDYYRQVCRAYRIDFLSRHQNRNLGYMLIIYLAFILFAAAGVIFTPLKWYWALMGSIILFVIMTLLEPHPDVEYLDVFIDLFSDAKKKNLPLYIVTMNEWVETLPSDDTGKPHLQRYLFNLKEDNMHLSTEVDRYTEFVYSLEASRRSFSLPKKCPRCGGTDITISKTRYRAASTEDFFSFFKRIFEFISGFDLSNRKKRFTCKQCGKEFAL